MIRKVPDTDGGGFGTRVGGYVRENKGKSAAIFIAFVVAVVVLANL